MSRVFILGAGASRFAGYPLAADLWGFVRDLSGGDLTAKLRRAPVVKEIERILSNYPSTESDQPNLEVLFTLLDLVALGGTDYVTLAHSDWNELRPKLIGMMTEAFLWHQQRFQSQMLAGGGDVTIADPSQPGQMLDRSRVTHVLKSWAKFLRPTDTILTFNWDILHETALWRAGKWHHRNGYGFSPRQPFSPASAARRSSPLRLWILRRLPGYLLRLVPRFLRRDRAGAPLSSGIRVLKLHGSVNWSQKDGRDMSPEIEDMWFFFPGSVGMTDALHSDVIGAPPWDENRRLVIPTYLKNISDNRLLLDLWNRAADTLASTTEWIVIGFQLYPADAPARQLFGSALLKNHGPLAITVVDPHAPYWPDFCETFDRKVTHVQKKFEDWITRMP